MDIKRNKLVEIKISDIEVSEESIKEQDKNLYFKLKNSIKLRGQLKNIVVCQNETKFECLEGSKTLKAMRELGYENVLCVNLGFIPQEQKNLVKIEISRDYFLTNYVAIGEMLKSLSANYKVSELCSTLPFDVRQVEKMISMTDFNWDDFEKNKMIEGQVSLFDLIEQEEETETQIEEPFEEQVEQHVEKIVGEPVMPLDNENIEEELSFDFPKPKPFVFPHDLDDYKAPDPTPKQPIMTNIERKILEEEMRKKEEETGISFDMPKHSEANNSESQSSLF